MAYTLKTGRAGEGYTPYGAVREFFTCKDHEAIIAGPAETGKTYGALMKLHICACKYAGAQLAIVRKTQQSIYGTVLQTYTRRVLSDGAPVATYGGSKPEWFDYPNGSRIFVGGMDNPGKVLSSERDIIYVNQTEELAPADWETLTTRTTGRAGNMPYSQCIGDCNPSHPYHWILERHNAGKLTLVNSTHKDNPTLFDPATGEITVQGKRTLEALAALTGARRARLLDGRWAQSEGVIYDEFTRDRHVLRRDCSEFSRFIVGIDEGYTNPAVALVVGLDGDDRAHIVEEFYQRRVLQDDFVRTCQDLAVRYDGPSFYVDPSAAGLIAAMRGAGLRVYDADNAVNDGIQAVKGRLALAGDGRPRLTVDPSCVNTIAEFETYVWAQDRDGKALDKPVKENDHAMDAARYLVAALFTAPPAGEVTEMNMNIYKPTRRSIWA